MLEQEQQFYFERLSAWNGYHRQQALQQLADCYEAALFPMLLTRLSDYVPINREIAAQHLTRWSERADFSDLCVHYFESVAAIQQRIRIVSTVEDLLLTKTAENMIAIKQLFLNQQGKRPRLFLAYIQRYQWLDDAALLEMCESARDQRVRGYWLNHLIQQDDVNALKKVLYSTPYRNIKMKVLPILYTKNALTLEDNLYFLQQPALSIMAFAIFALKKQNFDFQNYFDQRSFTDMNVENQRLRLYQWVLLGFAESDFKQMLAQVSQKAFIFSVLNFALKQNYLSSVSYLQCYVQLGGELNMLSLQQFNQKIQNRVLLPDLKHVCDSLSAGFSLLERMELGEDYGYWDKWWWWLQHQALIETDQEQYYFVERFLSYIQHGKHQHYAPAWQAKEKQDLVQQLDARYVEIEQRNLHQHAVHLKQVLQK